MLSAFAEHWRRRQDLNVRLAELAYEYVQKSVAAAPRSGTRRRAVRELAAAMREGSALSKSASVNRAGMLVRAHAVAVVFGEALAGAPWHLRMRMAPLVRRAAGYEERWFALPGLEEQCRALAERAGRGGLSRKALKLEAARLVRQAPPAPRMNSQRELAWQKRHRREPRPRPACIGASHPLLGVVKATAKDAASMLAQAASEHPDPESVVRNLLRDLVRCSGVSEQTRGVLRAALASLDGRVAAI